MSNLLPFASFLPGRSIPLEKRSTGEKALVSSKELILTSAEAIVSDQRLHREGKCASAVHVMVMLFVLM